MLMIVGRVLLGDGEMPGFAMHCMGAEAGAADGAGDGGFVCGAPIESDVHEPVNQVELDVANRFVRFQRTTDQRRLVGTVHVVHVHPQLRHMTSIARSTRAMTAYPISRSASYTASAWPATLTLSHRLATLPSPSMR